MDPEVVHDTVVTALPQTSMFAASFRECAARALLLPRRRAGERTPLWQQRQRAADLLGVAAKYPTFPMLLETSRECLQDVFDVPSLCEILGQVRSRGIRLVHVDTNKASPFAQSLMFNWIASYMYEGDAPLAERRAAALSLDRDLLNSLLGAEELRELLDADVLADLERHLFGPFADLFALDGATGRQRLKDWLRTRSGRPAVDPASPFSPADPPYARATVTQWLWMIRQVIAHARAQGLAVPDFAADWPGPVYALDFTGHGRSDVPAGGGYSAEILLADADHALAHLGTATVVGRGLGAYIALMLGGW